MHYNHVLKDYYTEYEELLVLQDEDKSDAPIPLKNLTPQKWT